MSSKDNIGSGESENTTPCTSVDTDSEGPPRVEGSPMVDVLDSDIPWSPFFRYDSAYADQYNGIEQFLDILKENGFYSLEGPCGTGKTLIAITAALKAIRSEEYPEYTRVCVFTPNKQQLRQFTKEMRGVNRSLPSGVDSAQTVVMKGKTDMMPYSFVEIPPFDQKTIHEAADDLRKKTREIIQFDSDIPLNWPDGMNPPASAHHDYDWSKASSDAKERREATPYDPIRAKCVRQILIDKENDDDYDRLVVDGVESPYPDVVPHTSHIVDTDELQEMGIQQLDPDNRGKFDPFYASFFAPGFPQFGFSDAKGDVLDRDALFKLAVTEGVCPHESMAHFARKADVVLGNYNHLYDPRTRRLTASKIELFDEETIVVVDEAHRIEEKVRKMLSTTLDIYTIDKAIADLQVAQAYLNGEISRSPTPDLNSDELEMAVELSEAALEEVSVDTVHKEDLGAVEELLIFLKQKLNELSADHLSERFSMGWQQAVERNGAKEEERPLTNVELPGADGLLIRQVISRFDDGEGRMKKAYGVFTAVDYLFEYLDEADIYDREPQGAEVGKFCYDWVVRDIVEYHREIVLDPSRKKKVPTEYPTWVREWTPKFQLYNCIPTEPLKGIFGEVGGGILMSATLSPPEAFTQAVGVEEVSPHDELTDTSGDFRRSEFDQFELRFPEENRLSLTVDLPKFTASNRGEITTSEERMTQTRKQYGEMIKTIVESEGNVMICMPKYAEAEWAYEWVQGKTSKSLFLDQSSTTEETNEMLDEFFEDSEDGAIFTSARGTITEGVDYNGSKLHCCAVIGIPMIDSRTERIKAVKYAYGKKISSAGGFETAIKIPAVRKSRQAIGRVIRGANDVGVRLLVDGRYGSDEWDGAITNLSEDEQEEFEVVDPASVGDTLSEFWSQVDREQAEKGSSKKVVEGESQPQDEESQSQDGGEDQSRSLADFEDYQSGVEESPNTSVEVKQSPLKEPSEYTRPSSGDVSKLYLGSGSPVKGWIPMPKEVIEEHIAPKVLKNRVDENNDNIQVNSSKDVDHISGWDRVNESVVLNEIVPLVEEYRFE
jgi:DNA excision repair protein ERCC-2